MAKKTDSTEEQFVAVEEALTKTEKYIENNGKTLGIAAVVIIAIFAAVYGYKNLYQAPLEAEAASEMFVAERFFDMDSIDVALNGNAQFYGFLDIADEYSSTDAGNLANYYAGLCYMQLGNFTEAISYLDKFSSSDELLETVRIGVIGDAFAQLKQPTEALEYYLKAANNTDNAFLAPVYLMKAGGAAEELGNYSKALNCYSSLKNDYPSAQESRDAEKYISRMEALIAYPQQ